MAQLDRVKMNTPVKAIKKELETKGYSQLISLNGMDLEMVSKSIRTQWLETLKDKTNILSNLRDKEMLRIEDYHLISEKISHKSLWTKDSRILPRDFFGWFVGESMIYKELENIFGEIVITDEEELGYGNIYWRLVRPYQQSDIGPLHRDAWFWEANDNYIVSNYTNYERIKVWIAINVEEGKNGLLVEPESHKRKDVEWEPEIRDGKPKPKLVTANDRFNPTLLNCKKGNAVIFVDELIHGGALNCGKETRVSAEFTIARPLGVAVK